MESSRELKSRSLMIPQICGGWKHIHFCAILLFSCCLILFGRSIFFGADFSKAVFSFSIVGLLDALFFFFGTALFFVAALFLGAASFLSDTMRVFFNYGDSLYQFLICMNSPEATPAFNPDRKVEFNHFLFFRRSACVVFLIVVMDKPVWSLILSVDLMIPGLYYIDSVCYVSQSRQELQVNGKYQKPYGASKTEHSSWRRRPSNGLNEK